MGLLRLPEPYDFELSTERYRAFGPDLANLWLEGSLHRVVGRREVRISAARGGVRVAPLHAETRPAGRRRRPGSLVPDRPGPAGRRAGAAGPARFLPPQGRGRDRAGGREDRLRGALRAAR